MHLLTVQNQKFAEMKTAGKSCWAWTKISAILVSKNAQNLFSHAQLEPKSFLCAWSVRNTVFRPKTFFVKIGDTKVFSKPLFTFLPCVPAKAQRLKARRVSHYTVKMECQLSPLFPAWLRQGLKSEQNGNMNILLPRDGCWNCDFPDIVYLTLPPP